jgi:hypothetical protein
MKKILSILIFSFLTIFTLNLLLSIFGIIMISKFFITFSFYSFGIIFIVPYLIFFSLKTIKHGIYLSAIYTLILIVFSSLYLFILCFMGSSEPDLLIYHKTINKDFSLCVFGNRDYFGTSQNYPIIVKKVIPGFYKKEYSPSKENVFWDFEKDSSKITYKNLIVFFPKPSLLNKKYELESTSKK